MALNNPQGLICYKTPTIQLTKLASVIYLDVENIISNINISKSVGPHRIPVKLYLLLSLFKKGDQNLLSNYQSISLRLVFSKIYEKL